MTSRPARGRVAGEQLADGGVDVGGVGAQPHEGDRAHQAHHLVGGLRHRVLEPRALDRRQDEATSSSGSARSSRPISSLSAATHGTRTSRKFHSSPITPPGRSTRVNSAAAAGLSNQCQAWPTVTASTLASASGSDSAAASCRGDLRQRLLPARRASRRPARTPSRAGPAVTRLRVSAPVPAPTSATSTTGRVAPSKAQRTASPGSPAGSARRPAAAAPNESSGRRTDGRRGPVSPRPPAHRWPPGAAPGSRRPRARRAGSGRPRRPAPRGR